MSAVLGLWGPGPEQRLGKGSSVRGAAFCPRLQWSGILWVLIECFFTYVVTYRAHFNAIREQGVSCIEPGLSSALMSQCRCCCCFFAEAEGC